MAKWFANGGEAKRGFYSGIFCDSSWELAYVVWCKEHNIEIVRNTKIFPYVWKKKTCGYKPDFIVNGTFVEIKGVMDNRSKRKISNFPFPLVVITKKQIDVFIDYVVSRYGDDFADKLYK